MLSFLKKKSETPAESAIPAWHPNFRNYERLPDIKVVRTAFFVNVGAVAVTLALAIYAGFNEWQIYSLGGQAAEQERLIEKNKAASNKAQADFKKFQAEEAKIVDVDAFVKSKPLFSPLLLHLGQTLPENIAIDNIDLRDTGLNLKLTVRGTPEMASGYATLYREQLANDKVLLATFGEAAFANLIPNSSTGRLAVEIVLPMKGAKK